MDNYCSLDQMDFHLFLVVVAYSLSKGVPRNQSQTRRINPKVKLVTTKPVPNHQSDGRFFHPAPIM